MIRICCAAACDCVIRTKFIKQTNFFSTELSNESPVSQRWKASYFTMIHVIVNTLKIQVSTLTLLIYTEMLNRSYAVSILDAELDFIDCTSKQNT